MRNSTALSTSSRADYPDLTLALGDGSCFIGNPGLYYLLQVLVFVSGLLTLTVLRPAADFLLEKWRIAHTYLDGKKLRFDGKLYQSYGIYFSGLIFTTFSLFVVNLGIASLTSLPTYFLNLLVSVAVTGINALFISSRMRRWIKRSTHYEAVTNGGSKLGLNLAKSAFVSLLTSILSLATLGLTYPAVYCIKTAYYTDMSMVSGDDIAFYGKVSTLYKTWFVSLFLCIVTLGLYIPMTSYKLYRWQAENTHVQKISKKI